MRTATGKFSGSVLALWLCSSPLMAGFVVGTPTLVGSVAAPEGGTDLRYTATVTNPGTETAVCATAAVSSASSTAIIVDGALTFGNVSANATVGSSDTFTVRQTDAAIFDPSMLSFDVRSISLIFGPFELVSSTRVTRTQFDYTYRVKVSNGGGGVGNAKALVSSSSPNTQVIDGELLIGSIAAGERLVPQDTITIRQNRAYAFDPSVLAWTIPCPQGETINHPPVIVSTAVTVGVAGQDYRYDVDANDSDGDALTYMLADGPAGMSIDGVSGLLSWLPTTVQAGSRTVTVRAVDPAGLADMQSFTLVISSPPQPNRAPVITSTAVTAAMATQPYAYGVVANDPDGDTLAYSLVAAPAGMAIDPVSGLINWAPTAQQTGTHAVTVRAADPAGLSAEQVYNLVVAAVPQPNRAPQIISSAQLLATVDTAYAYDVDATDPDSDALTFFLVDGPAGMVIDPASGRVQWLPGTLDVGTHAVTVRVQDPAGLADQQSYMLIVGEPTGLNDPPVITSVAPLTGVTDAAYTYDVDASDPDADVLAYALIAAPAGMTIDAASGLIQWTPNDQQTGAQPVRVRVQDTAGLADDQVFTVQVGIPLNLPPAANDDAYSVRFNETLTVAAPGVQANDTDPDGDPLTATLLSNPVNGTLTFANDGSFSYVPDVPTPGTGGTGFNPVLKYQALAGQPVNATPTVINLTDDNGDGRINTDDMPDIVFAARPNGQFRGGPVVALSGDDGHQLFRTSTTHLVAAYGEIAVGDIDGDGLPEIIGARNTGDRLVAFEHDGTFKWESTIDTLPGRGDSGGAIAIANLDGQGLPEIVVGASVYSAAGQLLGDGRDLAGTTGFNLFTAVSVVADIDLDGVPEIVAGPTVYRMVNGQLTRVWRRSDRGDGFSAVGNFDNDPFAEIVIVGGSRVYMLNHDGSNFTPWNPSGANGPISLPGGGPGGAPTIGDFDGDGALEFGVAGGSRYSVFEQDGTVRWTSVTRDASSGCTGSTIFDFDRDGNVEVVYRDEQFLRVYRGSDGTTLLQTPVGSFTGTEQPVVADVDNDGHAEIVVSSELPTTTTTPGIYVFEDAQDNWARTRRIWNQHSYHITNVNEDGTIPAVETPNWLVPGLNNFRLNAFIPGIDGDQTDSFTYRLNDGALDSNVATVRITVRPLNTAPEITSSALTNAAVGLRYAYAPQVEDPDPAETFAFSLESAPAGMSIDPTLGLIQWTPTEAQLGSHAVAIRVVDHGGLAAFQLFTVVVGQPITVPDVVSLVQVDAEASIVASGLTVGGVSNENHLTVPAGAVIAQTPVPGTAVEPGSNVHLVVSLGLPPGDIDADLDGFTTNAGDCDDTNAAINPNAIEIPANGVDENCDGVDAAAPPDPLTIDSDGDGLSENAGDCNDADASIHPGAFDPPGDGIDQNCNGADAVAGDNIAPTAIIDTPDADAVLTQPTQISGTAADDNFVRYTLAYSPVDANTFTTFATGTAPMTAAPLGTLDTTQLENGIYRIRLTVEDANGQTSIAERVYRVGGEMKVGVFAVSFVDLQVPVSGIPITVVRSYDSRIKSRKDFGVGWTLDVKAGKYQHNRTPGLGWVVQDRPFLGSFLPCIGGIDETRSHITEVRLSDREVYTFALSLTNNNLGITGACEATASFRFLDGPMPGATLEILDGTGVIYLRGGGDAVLDMNAYLDGTEQLYNPRRVRLTTIDGRKVDFDRLSGITRLEDNNGNALTINSAGVQHSSGKSISFQRDGGGRITRITDPMGNVLNYAYDARGDLVTFRDQLANATTFAYDAQHRLTEIHDPLGNRALQSEYDADGRLIAMTDAQGRRIAFAHNLSGREEQITDARGNVSRVVYDEAGYVQSQESAVTIAGVLQQAVTTYVHDQRGNELVTVDPDGVRVESAFDHENPTQQIVDPAGFALTTTYAYLPSGGEVSSVTNPAGEIYSLGYDARGNLTAWHDPAGASTTLSYDDRGRPVGSTDPMGMRRVYTHDGFGNVLSEEERAADGSLLGRKTYTYDANGNRLTETAFRTVNGVSHGFTTAFAYDARNRVVATTDPLGNMSRVEYNAIGKVAAQIDALGRRTSFSYDEVGALVRIDYADGSFETISYDASGNVASKTDAAGRITRFEYDELKRETRRIFPDGTSMQTIYTPGGQVAATIDSAGNRTDNVYDTAGRLVRTQLPQIFDAATGGNRRPEILRGWDTAGRPSSITDANGNQTTFVYSSAGKLERTVKPDGTATVQRYDLAGRVIEQVDENGQSTFFEYDGLGRLTAVVDAAGGRTAYSYDQAGNLLSATDAEGKTTTYVYDALNRLVSRTLPGGETETLTWDAVGNLESKRDFNGDVTLYTYDSLNRPIHVAMADGTAFDYTYTPTGERASVTDARGVTAYEYDSVGRPVRITHPGGEIVSYAYDAAGRMQSLTSPAGVVTYNYDAMNRLVQVGGPAGTFNYAYDAAGNLIEAAAPNGAVTRYTYDARRRITSIRHASGGTDVASYTYDLSPTGQRLRVTDQDGVEDYGYDALGRLVSEARIGTNPRSITYEYDAVGNRVRETRNGVVTDYSYDSNDRLLNAGPVSFGYDANGNLTSRTEPGAMTTYAWDARSRLTSVSTGAGTTEFSYDADGNRVGRSDASGAMRFLVDTLNPTGLPQVLEERTAGGALTAHYTYGRDLAAMQRGGAASFYHYDALGSTRALSDASGAVTDRYGYDGYGRLATSTGATVNPHRFTGDRFDDALGFYDFRARNYDPAVGRFIGRDPLPGAMNDPRSQHPHLYAHGDPVNRFDPTGRFTLIDVGATLGIGDVLRGLDKVKSAVQLCRMSGKIEVAQELLFWGQFAALGPIIASTFFSESDYINVGASQKILVKRFINVGKTPDKIVEASAEFGAKINGDKEFAVNFKREDGLILGATFNINDISKSTLNVGAGPVSLGFAPFSAVTDSSLAYNRSFDIFKIEKCSIEFMTGKFNAGLEAKLQGFSLKASIGLEMIGGLTSVVFPLLPETIPESP